MAVMMHAWLTDGQSTCGKRIPSEFLSIIKTEVTCGSCNRDASSAKRSWANKQSRLKDGYADSTFTGTGALSCYICGNPIRDHPGWPCSMRVDASR